MYNRPIHGKEIEAARVLISFSWEGGTVSMQAQAVLAFWDAYREGDAAVETIMEGPLGGILFDLDARHYPMTRGLVEQYTVRADVALASVSAMGLTT